MTTDLIRIDCGGEDPDQRIRREWGESLERHLKAQGLNRKQFLNLLSEAGYEVTPQGVSSWINGRVAPRPHMQAVIAGVLRVDARDLFPLRAVA